MSSLSERIANQSRFDNDLLLQNDRIGRASRAHENTVIKMKPRDEEAIREYQDQFPNSYEYEDENGDIKYRKYKLPENEPELEEVPDTRDEVYQDYFAKFDDNMKVAGESISNMKTLMSEKYQLIDKIKDKINNGLIKKKDVKRSMEFVGRIQQDIIRLKQELDDLENEVNTLPNERKQIQEYYDEDKTNFQLANKRNMERLQSYKDEINLMNRGQFDIVRQPEESEEAYITRLQQTAEIEVPEQELERAKQYTIKRFKEQLKEIIRSPSVIEQVSNSPEIDKIGEIKNKD